MLERGDNFKWTDFPEPKNGDKKDRFFICLGKIDEYYYLVTTTTNTERSESPVKCFSEKDRFIFYKRCCIYKKDWYNIEINTIEENKLKIEKDNTKIPINILNEIINGINISPRERKILKKESV